MPIQPPNIPALSSKVDSEVRRWCEAMKVWIALLEKSGGVVAPSTVSADVTAENIGAETSGTAAVLDAQHLLNFVHGDIAHSNRIDLDLVSGTNTGDQDLSGYELVGTAQGLLDAVAADTLDPTGWANPTAITVTYNSVADTVTLTGTLDYYWRGVKKSLTSPWTSSAHSATTGQSYFLSTADGTNFTWSTTPWLFSDLQVAFVQHGAVDLFCVRETHGCNTPWSVHEQDHISRGTFRESGGDLSGYVLASTTAANRRPAVSACVLHDEDLESTVTALPDNGPYTNVTLTTTAVSNFNTTAVEIVPVLVNNPYYNSYTAPNWTQTLMANNSYMCVWLLAVPVADDVDSQKYRFLWIQGQSSGNLTTQNALTPNDLNLGSLTSLSPEYAFIAKIVIRFQGGNWDITSVTNLTGSKTFYTGTAAGYLSTVTTDATLTGDGTVGNPLHVATTGGSGATEPFSVTFVSEDTTQTVNVVNAAITATSKIAAFIDGEEAAILEMAGRLLLAGTGSADIICHAPNGATGTYSGYISIS
ncbi:MAG: hypothetical protein ACOYL3_07045 [Desulfuromonadaceae bacterium]